MSWISFGQVSEAEASKVAGGLNAGYVLEVKPSMRIDAVYRVNISAPSARASEWFVLIPRAPVLPSQRILGSDTVPASELVLDRSPLRRSIHSIRIPVVASSGATGVRAEARTSAVLYSRKLSKSSAATLNPAPELSSGERISYTRRTVLFDHLSPVLRLWIEHHKLTRSGSEGEIDYARRVFKHIGSSFTYEYLGKQNRTAPQVCRAGKSDCGGLSVLFVAVMRSEGIPARMLAGRWAKSSSPKSKIGEVPYRQEHIIAEFFAEGVGWVPVDLAGAIEHDRTPEKLDYFGNDRGRFLTLHVDGEMLIQTRELPRLEMELMQRAVFSMRGAGTVKDSVMEEEWLVSEAVSR